MRKRFPLEDLILSIAYGLIDLLNWAIRVTPEELGAALASASRSLAPAYAFAFASGQQARVYADRAHSFIIKRFS